MIYARLSSTPVEEPEVKVAETAPDPLSYRAFLSEMAQGRKSAMEEAAGGQVSPESAAMNLESDVQRAAEEAIELLKRVVATAQRGGLRVQPERFCAKLSGSLSEMLYNIGRIEGYRG